MTIRKMVIGAALGIVGLPVVLVLTALASTSIANRTNGSILSSGEKREYLLYVPRSYDRAQPTPLVISLRAAMNWPAFQMKLSRWNNAADANGFNVVYPLPGCWSGPQARALTPRVSCGISFASIGSRGSRGTFLGLSRPSDSPSSPRARHDSLRPQACRQQRKRNALGGVRQSLWSHA